MEEQKLRDLLAQVHAALEGEQSLDDEEVALLTTVRRDIRRLLDQPKARDPKLTGRLREAATRLQTSHPTITLTLDHVISALANMGL